MSACTVAQALRRARSLGLDRLDAQLVVASVLGRSRAWLHAHDDDVIDGAAALRINEAFARRARGEPMAYILGEKEFHGLPLRVDARVLVPRPDTETLVDWALGLLQGELAAVESPRVVDLGTGSGAIALALKHRCPRATVVAVDSSDGALDVARENGIRLGLDVDWRLGHWWTALAGDPPYTLALSNPPYIAEGDAHLRSLASEPASALCSGPDGLDALREIIAQAPLHLAAGGWLLLEHGHDQGAAVSALLAERRFTDIQARHDVAGHWRCTGGRRANWVTKPPE